MSPVVVRLSKFPQKQRDILRFLMFHGTPKSVDEIKSYANLNESETLETLKELKDLELVIQCGIGWWMYRYY